MKTKAKTRAPLLVDRLGGLLDRAILPFAPGWANNRQNARVRFNASHYEAAKFDRTVEDFTATMQTADAALISDLATIISRSRVAFDNYPWARSIGNTYQRKVVGTGIVPIAAAVTEKGDLIAEFNRLVQRQFGYWSHKSAFCDVAKRSNYYQLQRLAIASIVHSGEMFIHRAVLRRPGSPSTLVLQALEVDQLNIDLTEFDGHEVRRGVELDDLHAPVAYHFLTRPDNDFAIAAKPIEGSMRIPAERITAIYDPTRPNQTHGVPHLGVVLIDLHQLRGYDQAELLAARMQACIGIILNPQGDGSSRGLAPAAADALDSDGNPKQVFQPGMVFQADEGTEATAFNPSRPNTGFDKFERAKLNAVAAGADLSRQSVARDYDGSFSSTRQGLIEDRQAMSPLQTMLIDGFCSDVWGDFVALGVLDGDFNAPGFFDNPHDWTRAEHIPPATDWIDPLKEVTATALALRHGITSLKREAARRGCHYLDLLDEQAEVARERAKRGLIDPDASSNQVSTDPVVPDTSNDNKGSNGTVAAHGRRRGLSLDAIAERLVLANEPD